MTKQNLSRGKQVAIFGYGAGHATCPLNHYRTRGIDVVVGRVVGEAFGKS